MRAGAQTLTLLATPLGYAILRALADGPRNQVELRRAAGGPAQSTLRNQLRNLEKVGVVRHRRRDGFPGALEYELTDSGQALHAVAAGLENWLSLAPDGPHELGGSHAKGAVKGLVDGWLARMLTPLAIEPLSLTELDRRLATISYPTIERRLEAMQIADQIEAQDRGSAGTPYRLRAWLRHGAAPLLLAARWERNWRIDGVEPIDRHELEEIAKLVAPLLEMSPQATGVCRLSLRPGIGAESTPVAHLDVADGVARCSSADADGVEPAAHAGGGVDAWLAGLIDGDISDLHLEGDDELGEQVFTAAHRVLFAATAAAESDAQG